MYRARMRRPTGMSCSTHIGTPRRAEPHLRGSYDPLAVNRAVRGECVPQEERAVQRDGRVVVVLVINIRDARTLSVALVEAHPAALRTACARTLGRKTCAARVVLDMTGVERCWQPLGERDGVAHEAGGPVGGEEATHRLTRPQHGLR